MPDATFLRYSTWMQQQTGVYLPASKKSLVAARLHKRLIMRGQLSLEAYFKLLMAPEEEQERQLAIDLLTTHETSFFRENKHFNWLHQYLGNWPRTQTFHAWCAASASGEEVWSLAMVLADRLTAGWQLLGSDISLAMLDKARTAHYPLARCSAIPDAWLRRFCLKGTGRQQGTLLINRQLRQAVSWQAINLDQHLPAIGPFDLIFMRNVLIYFNNQTRQQVVTRALGHLVNGGHLVISHSESLHGLHLPLHAVQAGVYRKAA